MSEQAVTTYTIDELQEVLTETLRDPELEQVVLAGLRARQLEREGAAEAHEQRQRIVDIVELHQRAEGSTSNIEGVISDLEDASLVFLRDFAAIENPTELEMLTAQAAATAFVYLTIQSGDFTIFNTRGVIEESGVDAAELIISFRQGVKQAWGVVDDSPEDLAMRVNLSTLEGLAEHLRMQLGPEDWRLIVDPPMLKLRQVLTGKGVELRELNENGKYDDEED